MPLPFSTKLLLHLSSLSCPHGTYRGSNEDDKIFRLSLNLLKKESFAAVCCQFRRPFDAIALNIQLDDWRLHFFCSVIGACSMQIILMIIVKTYRTKKPNFFLDVDDLLGPPEDAQELLCAEFDDALSTVLRIRCTFWLLYLW